MGLMQSLNRLSQKSLWNYFPSSAEYVAWNNEVEKDEKMIQHISTYQLLKLKVNLGAIDS